MRDTNMDYVFGLVMSKQLQVDDQGCVWRIGRLAPNGAGVLPTKKPRRVETTDKWGYLRIVAKDPLGTFVSVMAHRLVWILMHGDIPERMEVNHKDLDKTNNNPTNLELITASANIKHAQDAYRNGATDATKQVVGKRAAAEWVKFDSLTPWVRNPRVNDHRVVEIATSIARFGWGAPMLAWRDAPAARYPHVGAQAAGHRIVAGHLRYKALRYLLDHGDTFLRTLPPSWRRVTLGKGWFQLDDAPTKNVVPVRWVKFANEREYEALALRDNGRGGDWDDDELATILAEHMRDDLDVGMLGFNDGELERLGARGLELLDAAIADSAHDAIVPPNEPTPSLSITPERRSSPQNDKEPSTKPAKLASHHVLVPCETAHEQASVLAILASYGVAARQFTP